MKKSTRTLHLVFGVLLLLVLVSASTSAQGYFVEGQIRWNKDMGTVPVGPGNSVAAPSPCGIFSVAALDAKTQKLVVYTDQIAEPFRLREEAEYYVCRYSLKVPTDTSLYMVPTMGGVLLLPKEDDSPYLITGPWIGGSRSKPSARYQRGFTGHKYVNLRSRVTNKKVVWIVNFEMIYVNYDPN